MKTCIKCKQDKPESAFRRRLHKNIPETVCKTCKGECERKRREKLKGDEVNQLLKSCFVWP